MKTIYKYPTGAKIPEGAVYLSTVVQTHEYNKFANESGQRGFENFGYIPCYYVWHYFLVEVNPSGDRKRLNQES